MRTHLNVAFTYLAFDVGKQYFVIGDTQRRNLSVDYAQGWGGNKNAVKSVKVTFTPSFIPGICARESPGRRPQGSVQATGAVNDWPLLPDAPVL